MVGISGQVVQSNGKVELLVEGQKVWEEWMGSQSKTLNGGGDIAKEQFKAMEKAAMRTSWARCVERDQDYDKG